MRAVVGMAGYAAGSEIHGGAETTSASIECVTERLYAFRNYEMLS